MNSYEKYLYTKFNDIEENPIVLDFTGIKYLGEVHLLLKTKFGFPKYYGENWSALWDCLDGLFYAEGYYVAEIYGYGTMPKELQEGCVKMLEIFDDVHAETPNISFTFIS